MSTENEQTLYDRIGGDETVSSLIDEFYSRILADEDLKPFFENTSMEKLARMQKEFFASALDGPQGYSGQDLSYAHAGRGIKAKHFGLFIQHLLETLETLDLSDSDIREVIHRISTYNDDITGGTSLSG